MQQSEVQTRSGRISRPPPTPQEDDSDELSLKRGRPLLDPEERLERLRKRNKLSGE
jgi:hypothetical protein